jgi:multidrug efflux pump subunit AcrA (membrane-fusion protein)
MKKDPSHFHILRPLAALAILAVGGLLLAGCNGLTSNPSQQAATTAPGSQSGSTTTTEGHVVPRDSADLFFFTGGTVAEVIVKEGDAVKKGAVLARLGDRESLDAAIAAAEAELANAQRQSDDLQKKAGLAGMQAASDMADAQKALIDAEQKLADVDTTDYTSRLDTARDAVSKAKDDLKTAQEDFDKVKDLDKDNATRKAADTKLTDAQRHYDQTLRDRDLLINDLDSAKAGVDLAKARLDDITRTYNDRKSGVDPADQALVDARLKNAKAQLTAAQAALARQDLLAPYDGIVARVDISTGEEVAPNQVVMAVADPSQWFVETSDLTEKDVVAVRVGQKVIVTADALPDVKMNGKVERISNTSVEKAGDITYIVRISLSDPDPALRWGMTVKNSFQQK